VALKRACCFVVVALIRDFLGRISGGDRLSLQLAHFANILAWTGGENAHHRGVRVMGCANPNVPSKNIIPFPHPIPHPAINFFHPCLTHSYLLSGDDHRTCIKCDAVLTVKHILLDCPALRDVRLIYFTAPSLKDIFESVDNQIVIDFIKDAHFYHQM